MKSESNLLYVLLSCEFVTITAAAGDVIILILLQFIQGSKRWCSRIVHCGYDVKLDEEVIVEDNINRRQGDNHKSDF